MGFHIGQIGPAGLAGLAVLGLVSWPAGCDPFRVVGAHSQGRGVRRPRWRCPGAGLRSDWAPPVAKWSGPAVAFGACWPPRVIGAALADAVSWLA
eukprot:9495180-Pyramimonas_sp.AAC.2